MNEKETGGPAHQHHPGVHGDHGAGQSLGDAAVRKKRNQRKRLTAEQAYQLDYWIRNRERILANRKKEGVREHLAEYAVDYYERNKEKIMAYQKRYRAKKKRAKRWANNSG